MKKPLWERDPFSDAEWTDPEDYSPRSKRLDREFGDSISDFPKMGKDVRERRAETATAQTATANNEEITTGEEDPEIPTPTAEASPTLLGRDETEAPRAPGPDTQACIDDLEGYYAFRG